MVPSSISHVTDHHPTSIAATVICPLAAHHRSAGGNLVRSENAKHAAVRNVPGVGAAVVALKKLADLDENALVALIKEAAKMGVVA